MVKTKILVVDDEPDVELLIKQRFAKQLKSNEIEFVFASNGSEALKTLYQDPEIHVILTDINMPGMDGLTLLSHLQDINRVYKAVIISAYGDMSNIRKAMSHGASDFITKPIDFKDLENTVFNAIEQCLTLKKTMETQNLVSDNQKEIKIANSIQLSTIPPNFNLFPDKKTFEIDGKIVPSDIVGGDFLNFFRLDDSRLGFVIGDVSDKGLSAALFMLISRAMIRGIAQKASSSKTCLEEVNRMLCLDNEASMFAKVFYGIYHVDTGLIEYTNAGYLSPLLLKVDGTQSIMNHSSIPIGIFPDISYVQNQMTLNKGESLVLFSDGIINACNPQNEKYGETQFFKDIREWKQGPISTLTTHLLDRLSQFTQGTTASDDIALFCLRRLP